MAGTGSAVVFGASGGIGAALVRALIEGGGYSAVHAGVRTEPQDLHPAALPFRCDLTDEASIASAARLLRAPPVLIIVASGILQDPARAITPEKSLRAVDGAAMARVLAVNTIGPALVAKHFLPLVPRGQRAVFAALSARVGSIGDNRLGGWHAYRASKAALNMLVANFAIELARTHPLAVVATLHPGTVATRLSAPFTAGAARGEVFMPDEAAHQLLTVLDRLTPADSGGLFAWDGVRLPW